MSLFRLYRGVGRSDFNGDRKDLQTINELIFIYAILAA